MPRIRFKVFGAFHTQKLEREVNEWLRELESVGVVPRFYKKETRTAIANSGKPWIVVTFFYTLEPIKEDEEPLPEVDIDEVGRNGGKKEEDDTN